MVGGHKAVALSNMLTSPLAPLGFLPTLTNPFLELGKRFCSHQTQNLCRQQSQNQKLYLFSSEV